MDRGKGGEEDITESFLVLMSIVCRQKSPSGGRSSVSSSQCFTSARPTTADASTIVMLLLAISSWLP